jgi:hypothetical protein
MCEFTVISNHDCQVTCDHVYAVNADAALIMVAAARPGAGDHRRHTGTTQ